VPGNAVDTETTLSPKATSTIKSVTGSNSPVISTRCSAHAVSSAANALACKSERTCSCGSSRHNACTSRKSLQSVKAHACMRHAGCSAGLQVLPRRGPAQRHLARRHSFMLRARLCGSWCIRQSCWQLLSGGGRCRRHLAPDCHRRTPVGLQVSRCNVHEPRV
jgi:hypothetical protein